jgi:hypothetical protein
MPIRKDPNDIDVIWDENKNRINQRDHKVSFDEAATVSMTCFQLLCQMIRIHLEKRDSISLAPQFSIGCSSSLTPSGAAKSG